MRRDAARTDGSCLDVTGRNVMRGGLIRTPRRALPVNSEYSVFVKAEN
jgi:hypothetical protein